MRIAALRRQYHQALCERNIRIRGTSSRAKDCPNFADGNSVGSRAIAWGIIQRLEFPISSEEISGQQAGSVFERTTLEFLQAAFAMLTHLRPGEWTYRVGSMIADYAQYRHLAHLTEIVATSPELASALGGDYVIKPDIVIGRLPLSDQEINAVLPLVDAHGPVARMTPLRANNFDSPSEILHASISCKWTLRSDRSQNARTEGLNLIRNRKGNLPHIVAVTAEPLPMRIASLALGTGDLDCVYHIALPELREAVAELDSEGQTEMLETLISGSRLRDISDLPFDLAI